MKKLIILLIFYLVSTSIYTQIENFTEKFELPNQVKETSGLLFLNNKIITHNDSGDAANIYELDNANGNILRTVTVTNATNIDWEDIAEDDSHIYIGDFGNNNGNRTDLKIYKILKSDFSNKTEVTAEEISFSYEDQTDFTSRPNNNNFDAEALLIYENNIYIFSKNWTDAMTRVYKLPTAAGTYTATKVSSANVEGLITGATSFGGHIILCGYDATAPFVIFISSNRSPDDNVFSNGFDKYSFSSELGVGSQVEGITAFGDGKFYISREEVNNTFFSLKPKLFEYKDSRALLLSTKKYENTYINVFPNPTSDFIRITSQEKIESIEIFSILGSKIYQSKSYKEKIDISNFEKGIYLLKITTTNKEISTRRVIKF